MASPSPFNAHKIVCSRLSVGGLRCYQIKPANVNVLLVSTARNIILTSQAEYLTFLIGIWWKFGKVHEKENISSTYLVADLPLFCPYRRVTFQVFFCIFVFCPDNQTGQVVVAEYSLLLVSMILTLVFRSIRYQNIRPVLFIVLRYILKTFALSLGKKVEKRKPS